MKFQSVQYPTTRLSIALGISIYGLLRCTQAIPPDTGPSNIGKTLFEHDENQNITIVYIFSVTDTVFGQAATNYDFLVYPKLENSVEAIHKFKAAWDSGNELNILTIFINTTMYGTMTGNQAADRNWLCNQLDDSMLENVGACFGATTLRTSSQDPSLVR